jgi:hypothetical protein
MAFDRRFEPDAGDDIEQELTGEPMGAFVRTNQDRSVEDNPHWCER